MGSFGGFFFRLLFVFILLFSVVIIGTGSVFVYLRVIGLAKGECRV